MAGTRRRRAADEPVVRLLEKVGREKQKELQYEAKHELGKLLAAKPPDPHKDPDRMWRKFEALLSAYFEEKISQQSLDAAYRCISGRADADGFSSFNEALVEYCAELLRHVRLQGEPLTIDKLMNVAADESVEQAVIKSLEARRVTIAISNLKEEDMRVVKAWLTADGDAGAAAHILGWHSETFAEALSRAFCRLRQELTSVVKEKDVLQP